MTTKTQLFRDNVRYHIARLGVSQRELAERVKMSRPHLNRVLQGETTPGLDLCERIAEEIGIPLEGLIAESDKKLQKTG